MKPLIALVLSLLVVFARMATSMPTVFVGYYPLPGPPIPYYHHGHHHHHHHGHYHGHHHGGYGGYWGGGYHGYY